jgi:hypothetical protein
MKPARISTLFYLGLLGMELSYLYILASLLNGPAYTVILVLLPYPIALLGKLVLPRAAFSRRLRLTLELTLVALVIALAALGQNDVPGIILSVGLCGLSWLLGRTVPRQRVNYSTVALRLQIGVIAVLVFAQIAGSAPPVFLFFVLAPLALFLARWASSFSRGASVLRYPNPGHLLLGGAVVIVPGTAIVLASSPAIARAFVDWLNNISTKISDWMEAQHQAAANMTSDFKWDFSCSVRPENGGASSPSSTTLPSGVAGGGSLIVLWIIAAVILLAIALLIVLWLRRRKARRKARAVEPAEPVPFQIRMTSISMFRSLLSLFPQLIKKLWLWLTSLFQKLRKHPKPSDETLISIRALYRNLLRWAAKQGIARLPWQTPLEHLVLLEQGFPQQQDDLRQFTEAYLSARYSRKPVSPEEFDSAQKAWQRAMAYHPPSRGRS